MEKAYGRPGERADGAPRPAEKRAVAPNGKPAACKQQSPPAEPRYRASADFMVREIAGEIVMVPVGTGPGQLNGMLTVNESFRFLWDQFKEPHTVREVAEKAMEQFDGTAEQITKDISDFAAESRRLGFLTQEETEHE